MALQRLLRICCLLALVLLAGAASAVEPDEILKDAKLEARARTISAELRCLVCQNQSIDDSNAPLARDLRLLVRERLQAGDADEDVIRFVVSRYGEFVLLRPRFSGTNILLWLAPILLLLAGVLALARRAGRSRPVSPPPLTAEEKARLEGILASKRDA